MFQIHLVLDFSLADNSPHRLRNVDLSSPYMNCEALREKMNAHLNCKMGKKKTWYYFALISCQCPFLSHLKELCACLLVRTCAQLDDYCAVFFSLVIASCMIIKKYKNNDCIRSLRKMVMGDWRRRRVGCKGPDWFAGHLPFSTRMPVFAVKWFFPMLSLSFIRISTFFFFFLSLTVVLIFNFML